MDDEDSLNILQQIFRLNILDSDPHRPTILEAGSHSNQSASMVRTKDNIDDRALFAAIVKYKTIDKGKDDSNTQKPKRGRPRKRVVHHGENTC
jgi:hypothetical protein